MLHPRILFKYLKFDKSCLELLLNHELWFATPASLNDPFEGESSFSDVLDAVWERYPISEKDRKHYHDVIKKQLSMTGICSFSKSRKNQLMWAHYADEHKGVCIGFKEPLIRPAGSMISSIDVTYQDDYPFKEIIERFYYFENQQEINNLMDIAGDIIYSVLKTKYTSWSYERERRLVTFRSQAIEFPPQAVNSITFGLRTEERDKVTLKNIISGDKWSHVKWFQAVKSNRHSAPIFGFFSA